MDAPDVATLQEIVAEAVTKCMDCELLDLILKLLSSL